MKAMLLALIMCVSASCAHVAERSATMPRRDGFFRVEEREGRWWFIDPEGKPFISKGCTTVGYAQDTIQGTNRSPLREANEKKYGSVEAWRKAAAGRLIDWGFNTLGAWSDEELSKVEHGGKRLAYSVNLDIGSGFVAEKKRGASAWLEAIFPDVFDPAFAEFAGRLAREKCAGRKDDPMLLGWFTDNELHWGPDWRKKQELLTEFLNLPAEAAGRKAAVMLLQKRHRDFAAFEKVWKTGLKSWEELGKTAAVKAPFDRPGSFRQNEEVGGEAPADDPRRLAFVADCDAFLGVLAEKYFQVCEAAIREADGNHLIFGPRFAYVPAKPVVEAASRHLDVIAFNCYHNDPTDVIAKYEAFGRPLMIGEFSFRGQDAGLPNEKGAGPKVENQKARAAAMENYVRRAVARPKVVGYHWFEHADEPREGRFDGENSNYGLVTTGDEVYREVTEGFVRVNGEVEGVHGGK